MELRSQKRSISPSLVRYAPSGRTGAQSPSLKQADSRSAREFFAGKTQSEVGKFFAQVAQCFEFRPVSERQEGPSKECRDDDGSAMLVAQCKRASRMARPSEPSEAAMRFASGCIHRIEMELRNDGFELSAGDGDVTKYKMSGPATGKGPAIRASSGGAEVQATMNHISIIKSKSLPTACHDASWLLPTGHAELTYGRLAAVAMQTNAVNASVTNRGKTQGAANQTSRIGQNKSINQAAAAQAISVATTMAVARGILVEKGYKIRNPMATNAINPTMLWWYGRWSEPTTASFGDEYEFNQALNVEHFAISTSSKLLFNACPTKLSAESILSCARKLAQSEIDDYCISEAMGASTDMLESICHAITAPGETALDTVWSSIVLVVYLCCHPRGREILRSTNLTDVDYHTAMAFEAYGRAEITRRARLEAQQAGGKRKKNKKASHAGDGLAEDPPTDDDALDDLDAEESKVLATKRKRGAKGCASASTSDSLGMLVWWHKALRCENSSVLLSLVAHTKQAARDAACATLKKQAGNVGSVMQNEIIRGISEQNAVESAKALVPFVGRKPSEVPALLKWKWNGEDYFGMTRTHNEARFTQLHACKLNWTDTRSGIAVAWSDASLQYAPQTEVASVMPCVAERLNNMATLAFKGKRQAVAASRMSAITYTDAEAPRTTEVAGITRSFISVRFRFDINASQLASATQLSEEMQNHQNWAACGAGCSAGLLVGESRQSDERREPIVTPCSSLAVGIALNEELKGWLASPVLKTRKNNYVKVLLGTATQQELARDAPSIINSEPPPLLTICDVQMDMLPGQIGKNEQPTEECVMGVSMSVCGDAAVRLPEALDTIMANGDCKAHQYMQARSMLWAACSQSSFIADVGPSISASNANSAIASSKKISIADVHRLPLCSPFDTYCVGLANIEPSHLCTPYAGTYGCPLDTGISPPGLFAHNLRSDRRQHGNMTLSESVADELSAKFAEAHWVKFKDSKLFCEAPVYTRGVPHGLIPGIHACCDYMVEGLEQLREHNRRTESTTVDVIASLPFSPWTQAIAPTIEATADLSIRLCVRDPSLLATGSGKAYLPDSTDPERAIVRPPLLDGPVQVSMADNPFGTSYEAIGTFFNLACTLALLSQQVYDTPSGRMDPLAEVIDNFVHSHGSLKYYESMVAVDALVMLSAMYPCNWKIAEPCIHDTWAKAMPRLAKLVARDLEDLFSGPGDDLSAECHPYRLDDIGLTEQEVEAGRAWWKAFVREDDSKCAWKNGVGPLINRLKEHNGSYDVTKETCAEMRVDLERAVRAAYLVHSEDGVAPPADPCPAAKAKSMDQVKRPHVDPTFVGDSTRSIDAKGCLVGIKPHQLRQIAALSMGAHLKDVEVQVSRNEGGLSLRVSSAADILEADGRERTAKSISPVQTEADELAFGSRKDKLVGCALQRKSWDDNTRLMTPIFTAVRQPLPKSQRLRGELGAALKKQRASSVLKRDQMQEASTEVDARHAIEDAVMSRVAQWTQERENWQSEVGN